MVSALHLLFAIAMQFLHGAHGHAYMSWPASRNFDDCNNFEPQSVNQHCDNCNTESCGLYRNINYGSVVHAPTGSYVAGGLLGVETIVTAHHKGYMEVRICSRPDDLTQDCFDEHLLVRDSETAAGDPAPVDESHPGRWYIPPPDIDWSPDAISVPSSNACSRSKSGTARYRWTVRLPSDLECEHCVVQLFWVTANSCNPAGFHEYFGQGSTQTWITDKFGGGAGAWWKPLLPSCPPAVVDPRTNNNGAEKFWNCADIKVSRCSGQSCTTPIPSSTTTSTASLITTTTTTTTLTMSSELTSTRAPTSTSTRTVTSSSRQCIDATLPVAWSAGGVHTCLTYEQHGLAHCNHEELKAACCFCGGGQPEPEPEPEPVPTSSTTTLPCADSALPIAWSGGGVHTCLTYNQHGGLEYCSHGAIKVACCFCGGGSIV